MLKNSASATAVARESRDRRERRDVDRVGSHLVGPVSLVPPVSPFPPIVLDALTSRVLVCL
jgi:hypothetical protein